jgi:NAD(P)-dependent dehydrogenase (short-subunit alcohol dehydrogenase family)
MGRRTRRDWGAHDIPDQSGRTAVVTGANSGLGLETARALARAGARVVLACRNEAKGKAALDELRADVPQADLELLQLDLADLASVRAAADALAGGPLHVLVNNAGLMAVPYARTVDGFEVQMGVNHLGHFALTGLLLPTLLETPGARVVTLSSLMAYRGRLRTLDHGRYSNAGLGRWAAYCDSKLANVAFALELDRRLRAAGAEVVSASAHPGYAATELQTKERGPAEDRLMGLVNRVVAQPAEMGALPSLYAATAPSVGGGELYGPDGPMGLRGRPRRVRPPRLARDPAVGERLWRESVALTGVDPGL